MVSLSTQDSLPPTLRGPLRASTSVMLMPRPFGLGAGGFIRQSRPYAAFGIHHNGYGAFAHPVGKRSADAYGYGHGIAGHWGGGISYSNRSPQGLGAYWG